MGLAALGIAHGDEVILADTNWIATVSPIIYLGAKPIFVDIDPRSWCIDPAAVETAISPKTKAIIATHLYGNVCDMDRLLDIGNSYSIPVIEDAAEAIGSRYHSHHVGTLGLFGVFSFHGTKTMTTGEGGMLITNNTKLYEKVLTLSNHGRDKNQQKQFWPDLIGFKYKMSNVQAAIGCAQLNRIGELVARKQQILNFYKEQFKDDAVMLNFESSEIINGAWMPNIVFSRESGINRDLLLTSFRANNIDARVFFWPLSGLPMFMRKFENVNSWDIPGRSINLPSFHDITEEQLYRVVGVIRALLDNRQKK
jgi:perosamine synthetase